MDRTFGAGVGKGQPPGLFEGQRPGPIPAYGIAIGIGFWNSRRAEGPVSFRGLVAGNDGSGLQPLEGFNVAIPGAVPQAGMDRTFGAGEGENRESTPMDAKGDGRMGLGRVIRRWRRLTQMGGGRHWGM